VDAQFGNRKEERKEKGSNYVFTGEKLAPARANAKCTRKKCKGSSRLSMQTHSRVLNGSEGVSNMYGMSYAGIAGTI
jgi:hypothetical protein